MKWHLFAVGFTRISFNWEALLSALLIALPKLTLAQSTFDALAFGPGIPNVGYINPSTGWAFVPTTDLRVVAVGCLPMQGSSVEIAFWQGTNQIIANYPIALQGGQTGDVVYQSVDGITLSAGSQYAVSVVNPGALPVNVYSRQGADGYQEFSTSPYIGQFEDFQVSTNNQWSPLPAPPANNSDWLFFGPTFQFQLLHQLSFAATVTNLLLSWPTQSVAYAVQQNRDFNSTNWVTLTNLPVVMGSQNQVTLAKPQATMFYRLLAQ